MLIQGKNDQGSHNKHTARKNVSEGTSRIHNNKNTILVDASAFTEPTSHLICFVLCRSVRCE